MYAGMLTPGLKAAICLEFWQRVISAWGRRTLRVAYLPYFDAAASGSVWLYGLRQDAINRTISR
jgi:hypothetical protein